MKLYEHVCFGGNVQRMKEKAIIDICISDFKQAPFALDDEFHQNYFSTLYYMRNQKFNIFTSFFKLNESQVYKLLQFSKGME